MEHDDVTTDDDSVFSDPEAYGIQNLEAPGEPDRADLPPVDPVPGTAKKTRDEHLGLRGGHHNTTEGEGHRGGHGNR